MRVDVDTSDDGEPTQVRVMTDDGEWTTFWPARECQERARQAAVSAYDRGRADMAVLLTGQTLESDET